MSATSQVQMKARPPAASISCLVSSSFSSPRATRITLAPAAAIASAVDLPMPDDEPVTTTTLFLTRPESVWSTKRSGSRLRSQ